MGNRGVRDFWNCGRSAYTEFSLYLENGARYSHSYSGTLIELTQWEAHYATNRVVMSLVGCSRSWIVAKRCVASLQLLLKPYPRNSMLSFQPHSVTLNLGSVPHFWNCPAISETNSGKKFKYGMQLVHRIKIWPQGVQLGVHGPIIILPYYCGLSLTLKG